MQGRCMLGTVDLWLRTSSRRRGCAASLVDARQSLLGLLPAVLPRHGWSVAEEWAVGKACAENLDAHTPHALGCAAANAQTGVHCLAYNHSLWRPAGGIFVTDVTNASHTVLTDLASLSWHEPALQIFDVPADALPRVRSSAEVYGTVAANPLAGVPTAGACL